MLKRLKISFFRTCIVSLAFVISTFQVQAAQIKSDIIMIVDESGSMGPVQDNLRDNIALFASIMSAGGIDVRFALVGYGASFDQIRTVTDFTDAAGFGAAAATLISSGSDEDAYDAIAYALNSYGPESSSFSFRNDAVKNVIIFTDEPDGNGELNFSDADSILTANNALFNAVLSGFHTISSIGPLADNHGGSVFDLNGLNTTDQSVVQTFVTNFANAKLQETIGFCTANPQDPACRNSDTPNPTVPEPTSLLLFGLAGLALKFRRIF
ncbi:vWA domain-containing protein [Thalassotalea sp. PS06]|uniref:vWA domain-containing protein n=1 Tax=Thalassotalea sp. PS06 TaxID=2594005 RepID=UPI001163ABBC|nr:vWA domain-containing protein [Thalassotalea sp. PS06]QDP02909.1 VWA domain-containing protein [Thalassotalea sp. PS06]